jgi:hypothetical protein
MIKGGKKNPSPPILRPVQPIAPQQQSLRHDSRWLTRCFTCVERKGSGALLVVGRRMNNTSFLGIPLLKRLLTDKAHIVCGHDQRNVLFVCTVNHLFGVVFLICKY